MIPFSPDEPRVVVVCHNQSLMLDTEGSPIRVQGWFDNLPAIAEFTDRPVELRYLPKHGADFDAAQAGARFPLIPDDDTSPLVAPLPIEPKRFERAKRYFDHFLWPWAHENTADLTHALERAKVPADVIALDWFRLNAEVALALLEDTPSESRVIFHEIHFALVPGMLNGSIGREWFESRDALEQETGRYRRTSLATIADRIESLRSTKWFGIAAFSHIPFPDPNGWNQLPGVTARLIGESLRSTLTGVHDARWAENLAAAGGRPPVSGNNIAPFVSPIGVNVEPLHGEALHGHRRETARDASGKVTFLGVDRIYEYANGRDIWIVHGRVDPKNEIPVVLNAFAQVLERDADAPMLVLQAKRNRPGDGTTPYDRDFAITEQLVAQLNERFGKPDRPVVVHTQDDWRPRVMALATGSPVHPGAIAQVSASQIGGFDQVGWEGLAMNPEVLVPVITSGVGAAPTLKRFAVMIDDLNALPLALEQAFAQGRANRAAPASVRATRRNRVEAALATLNHRDWNRSLLAAADATLNMFTAMTPAASLETNAMVEARMLWAQHLPRLPQPHPRTIDREDLGRF